MQLERFVVKAFQHPVFETVTLGSYKSYWRAKLRAVLWRVFEADSRLWPEVWIDDKLDDKQVN